MLACLNVEIMKFKLAEDVDESAYLEAYDVMQIACLKTLEGFVGSGSVKGHHLEEKRMYSL